MIEPLAKRLEVAAFLSTSFTFNEIGCRAHAKSLRNMARVCDIALEQAAKIVELEDRIAALEAPKVRKRWWHGR